MKITTDNLDDPYNYYIFIDDLYLEHCIEADSDFNYAIIYDSAENKFADGFLFKKPFDILLYRRVYGNISIVKMAN